MLCKGGDSGPILGVLDGYVSWEHPYRHTQIHIHPLVVRSLSSHALECAKRGLEVGGVLWGKAGPENSLVILDAALAQSSGPFFNATAIDARAIEQKLAARPPKSNLSLAGYFRSTIREGLALTPQDQLIIRHCVRDPDSIFLVIKPGASGVCTAGLTFWEGGFLQTDASYLEIPFISVEEPLTSIKNPSQGGGILKSGERAPTIDQQLAELASQEEPSIVASVREWTLRNAPPTNSASNPGPNSDSKPIPPNEPVGEEFEQRLMSVYCSKPAPKDEAIKRRTRDLLFLVIASICLIAVITTAGVYLKLPMLRPHPQAAPEQHARLGLDLQVTRAADGQLNLNWNRSAPEVVNALGALVTITDGRRTNNVKLDTAELRSGTLMYSPKTGDVQFRLELYTDELHSLAESVRVVSSGAEPPLGGLAENSEHPDPVARVAVPTEWTVTAELQSSHAVINHNSGTAQQTSYRNPAPLPLPPVGVPPLVTGEAPVAPPQTSPIGLYAPPQVLEEMMPETKQLGRVASVTVQVSIDQTGHVTAARPLRENGVDNPELAAVAVAAAEKWRFQPAMLNGKPVPAEYKIIFAFHRQVSR
jgi:TonB family protein